MAHFARVEDNIVREVNIAHLIKTSIESNKVVYPFKVLSNHIKVLLKTHTEIEKEQINPLELRFRIKQIKQE